MRTKKGEREINELNILNLHSRRFVVAINDSERWQLGYHKKECQSAKTRFRSGRKESLPQELTAGEGGPVQEVSTFWEGVALNRGKHR